MSFFIGIDVGGTWVRVALADQHAKIIKKNSSPISATQSSSFIEQIFNMVNDVAGDQLANVERIGLGMAGRLDLSKGIIVFSPHSCLRDIPVKEIIEDKFGKDSILANDNAAAALAEKHLGAGKSYDNLVYVGIGTGIGGGAIVDGHLLLGKDGNAHEMGHMIVDMNGRLECSCGGRGHWEAYASGSGLPAYARLLSNDFAIESLLLKKTREGHISAKEIFECADGGDPFADHVLKHCTKVNAQALANLVNLYDPSLISIGGGVALKNAKKIILPLSADLQSYAFNRSPLVVASPLGESTPLYGAVLIAIKPDILN